MVKCSRSAATVAVTGERECNSPGSQSRVNRTYPIISSRRFGCQAGRFSGLPDSRAKSQASPAGEVPIERFGRRVPPQCCPSLSISAPVSTLTNTT